MLPVFLDFFSKKITIFAAANSKLQIPHLE